jgi:hypothetical protein
MDYTKKKNDLLAFLEHLIQLSITKFGAVSSERVNHKFTLTYPLTINISPADMEEYSKMESDINIFMDIVTKYYTDKQENMALIQLFRWCMDFWISLKPNNSFLSFTFDFSDEDLLRKAFNEENYDLIYDILNQGELTMTLKIMLSIQEYLDSPEVQKILVKIITEDLDRAKDLGEFVVKKS